MTEDQIKQIVEAIRRISYGDTEPMGLEMLSMAISGPGKFEAGNNLADSVRSGLEEIAESISDGLGDVSSSLLALASAIEKAGQR